MEKERPRVGVGVAVVKEGKVLLGKRKGAHGAGLWAFPGGHLEYKEEVASCAMRELAEETGLLARAVKLGPWIDNVMDDTKHYITLVAFVNDFEGQLQLLEPHKCEGWHWFAWDSLPCPLFSPIDSLILKMGLENLMKGKY